MFFIMFETSIKVTEVTETRDRLNHVGNKLTKNVEISWLFV